MKFKVFVVLHVPYCNQHVLDSLFHPVVNEYRYFFLWRVGVFWKSTFKLSWCTFSQAIVLSLYIAKSCFITKCCKAEYSRVICYAKFKLVLILHTACCYCISIKQHVLRKLRFDDQWGRIYSKVILFSTYPLLTLVNSLKN